MKIRKICFVALFLLVAGTACSHKVQDENANTSAPESVNTSAPEAAVAESVKPEVNNTAIVIGEKPGNADRKDERVKVSWKYPTFGIEAVDTEVAKAVEDVQNRIIKDFKENFGDDETAELNCTIAYETIRATEDGIDIALFTDIFVTGTAHPSGEVISLMLDAKTGKRITTQDLLDSGKLNIDSVRAEAKLKVPEILKADGIGEIPAEMIQESLNQVNFSIVRTENGYRAYINPGDLVGAYRAAISFDVPQK